jgi:hypothetical protein
MKARTAAVIQKTFHMIMAMPSMLMRPVSMIGSNATLSGEMRM